MLDSFLSIFGAYVLKKELWELHRSSTCAKLVHFSSICSYCKGNIILLRTFVIKNILCCSVFILMKGATKKRAFEVGYEIVDAVTKMNPQPMKLKFEKVS